MKSKLVQSIEDNGIDLPDDIYKNFGHSILEVLNSESEIDEELSGLINSLNELGGEYSGMACFRFDLIIGLCKKMLSEVPDVRVRQILFAAEEGKRLLSLGMDLGFIAEGIEDRIPNERTNYILNKMN